MLWAVMSCIRTSNVEHSVLPVYSFAQSTQTAKELSHEFPTNIRSRSFTDMKGFTLRAQPCAYQLFQGSCISLVGVLVGSSVCAEWISKPLTWLTAIRRSDGRLKGGEATWSAVRSTCRQGVSHSPSFHVALPGKPRKKACFPLRSKSMGAPSSSGP